MDDVDESAFVVGQDARLGRHLLAARDLDPGEIVVSEKPIG